MKCLKCLCPGAHRPGEPCEALWWRCPTTLEKMLECRVQVSFYEMDTTAYGTVRAQYGHNMGSVWARSRYGNSMGNASTCFDGIDRQDGNFVALSLDSWVPRLSNITIILTAVPRPPTRPLAASPPNPARSTMARLVHLLVAFGSAVALLLIRLFWRRRSLLRHLPVPVPVRTILYVLARTSGSRRMWCRKASRASRSGSGATRRLYLSMKRV